MSQHLRSSSGKHLSTSGFHSRSKNFSFCVRSLSRLYWCFANVCIVCRLSVVTQALTFACGMSRLVNRCFVFKMHTRCWQALVLIWRQSFPFKPEFCVNLETVIRVCKQRIWHQYICHKKRRSAQLAVIICSFFIYSAFDLLIAQHEIFDGSDLV